MADDNDKYFGKDCPKEMVQIEFVGCDPTTKHGEYGWKPCKHTFLEVYIDGERFRIDVGDFASARGGTRRGLHIIGPVSMSVDKHSLNAIDLFLSESPENKD